MQCTKSTVLTSAHSTVIMVMMSLCWWGKANNDSHREERAGQWTSRETSSVAREATKSQIECNNANGLRSHPYSELVFTFFLHTQSWTDPIWEWRHLSDMSIILQKQSPGLAGSFSDQYGECCPPVLDPYTLLALLGGIALTTFFLQQPSLRLGASGEEEECIWLKNSSKTSHYIILSDFFCGAN